jgi:hypothetical protein
MITEYLKRYINVVKWDINQIVRVANGAQAAYYERYGHNTSSLGTPTSTPSIASLPNSVATPTAALAPTTSRDPNSVSSTPLTNADLFHQTHAPEFARCAVPLAMVLTSVVEFFGTLLHSSNILKKEEKFDLAVKNFYSYSKASPPLTQAQVDLFRVIYRNGLMHGFFPQGSNVAINYDTSLVSKPLLFEDKGDVVLNVNKLLQVVESVFLIIVADTSVHQTIQDRLLEYETYTTKKTHDAILAYKDELANN